MPVPSMYARTPPNKHGGVDRQQQHIVATRSCHEKTDTTIKVIGCGQGEYLIICIRAFNVGTWTFFQNVSI